jgi:peptidoglycan-N-acetylglucosamine deacetylase
VTDSADSGLSVCLTFDFDAISCWIGTLRTANPVELSRGEFGPYALPRILRLLRDFEVKATFFVPGHTALAYPRHVAAIIEDGHEIGAHGWVHEHPSQFSTDVQRAVFEHALAALNAVAGISPRGYRAPGLDYTPDTVELLLEYGFSYDASFIGSDFYPYYLRSGDRWSSSGPYVFGEVVDIVGVPFVYALDDIPHFEVMPPMFSKQARPSEVLEIWRDEFDFAYAECPGGVFDLTMHPQCIGRGPRLRMLGELVEHMMSKTGITFTTMGAFADRWRAAHPLEQWKAGSIASSHTGRDAITGEEWFLAIERGEA